LFSYDQATRAAASEPSAAVAAAHASSAIHVDGALDEEAWTQATIVPDLTQQDPHPGDPTPFRTVMRILIDQDNLYLGFDCYDPQPERIAVHTQQRDGELDGDDHLSIVLDTFGDERNGYFFLINAAGARQDGLIFGPDDYSKDWDGIWYGRAVRTSEGWTAEVAIPAKTLRFDPKLAAFGINLERYVPRDRLTLRWTGTSLDARLVDMHRAGRLEGVGELQQGLGLTLQPYGLARYESDHTTGHSRTTGDVGGEVGYNFTPSLTGVLTINTDFAETEVDQRQINLTRFPLFFPEKRPFFLEGQSQFDFGLGLGEDFIPFFSRRVGLFAGEPVPILAGVKLLGRAGRWGFGALDAYTDEAAGAERANLFAARVTYDVDEHLRVGAIATDGDPAGVADNRLGGLDAVWQTASFAGDKNFAAGGWYARGAGDLAPGDAGAYGFKVDYPNDLWDVAVSYKEFGEALDPKLGFLPRPGRRFVNGGAAFQPRPEGGPFGWVRQFFFETEVQVVERVDGPTESWELFTAPFNVRTQSGEHLEANWIPQFERLFEPFEIATDVVIPPGDYRFTRYRVEAQSSEHRPWRVGSTVRFGEFFDGRLTQASAYAQYTTPAGHLSVEAETENDYGDLPEGEFTERLHVLRSTYSFNPDLWIAAFAQYDSISRNVGLNLRMRWTVQPGNDVYVVWSHDWVRPLDAPGEEAELEPVGDQLVVKARWTFRR
jgi:hypothetical protein